MNASRLTYGVLIAVLVGTAYYVGRQTRRQADAGATAHRVRAEDTAPGRAKSAHAGSGAVVNPADAVAHSPDLAAASSAPAVLARLKALAVTPREPQSVRRLLIELEALRALGPAALPAIQDLLASGHDTDFDTPLARSGFREGRVPVDFVVPPSLRLALLEVVKNIGGPAATEMLVHELKTTGRGVEAAYIAGALQQLAPGKYQDTALSAARDLLGMPLGTAAPNPLDRGDREYLYGMLATAGDRSQVAPAQAQLVLPTGAIDRGALRFLQQTLGEESVAIAARTWDDPRVPPSQRTPLAEVALAYVGASDRAEQLWLRAINSAQTPADDRKDLIEDLNQTGFANPKQLTPADLPLIQRRLALIDQQAPRAMDAINAAAFAEARKDLVKMRDDLIRATPPKK